MELFRFKLSDIGKTFDVKILTVEEEVSLGYHISNGYPYKPTTRIVFYALVNGMIELVDTTNGFLKNLGELIINREDYKSEYFFRVTVNSIEKHGREFISFDVKCVESDMYSQRNILVQKQISEFDLSFEGAKEILTKELGEKVTFI